MEFLNGKNLETSVLSSRISPSSICSGEITREPYCSASYLAKKITRRDRSVYRSNIIELRLAMPVRRAAIDADVYRMIKELTRYPLYSCKQRRNPECSPRCPLVRHL